MIEGVHYLTLTDIKIILQEFSCLLLIPAIIVDVQIQQGVDAKRGGGIVGQNLTKRW